MRMVASSEPGYHCDLPQNGPPVQSSSSSRYVPDRFPTLDWFGRSSDLESGRNEARRG